MISYAAAAFGDLVLEHFVEQVDAAVSAQSSEAIAVASASGSGGVVDDPDGFPVQIDEVQQVGDR